MRKLAAMVSQAPYILPIFDFTKPLLPPPILVDCTP